MVLTAISNSDKDYTVQANIRVDSILYTGKPKSFVKSEAFEVVVEAGTEQTISMSVSYKEYALELSDQGAFKMACLAKVDETNYEFFSQDDFCVCKPDNSVAV